jgi:hypothetical protein
LFGLVDRARGLECVVNGEIGGFGFAGDIGVAGEVEGDGAGVSRAGETAEIGEIEESFAVGGDVSDEGLVLIGGGESG